MASPFIYNEAIYQLAHHRRDKHNQQAGQHMAIREFGFIGRM
jgi:hypothetical protein